MCVCGETKTLPDLQVEETPAGKCSGVGEVSGVEWSAEVELGGALPLLVPPGTKVDRHGEAARQRPGSVTRA